MNKDSDIPQPVQDLDDQQDVEGVSQSPSLPIMDEGQAEEVASGGNKRASAAKSTAQKATTEFTSFKLLPDGAMAEMCCDPKSGEARFAIYREGVVSYRSLLRISPTVELRPYIDDLPLKGVIYLPSEATPYGTEFKLHREILAFIHEYVEISPFYERLASHYAMFTWLYDRFDALPYLRALGDYATGKSRFLKVVGSLCYKATFTGGATTSSPIFRLLEKYHGTLVLDEADFKISDTTADMVKILNCGYSKGVPVLRTVGDTYEPKAFDVFGPKILATREEWQDRALESRCLTEKMRAKQRQDIPELLGKGFDEKALLLRNKLLMFRFDHYASTEPDLGLRDSGIESRLNQVMIPLLSVIKDPQMRNDLRDFMCGYNRELVADRGMSLEAEILEAISRIAFRLGLDNTDSAEIHIKAITDEVNLSADSESTFTPKRISDALRKKLNIATDRDRLGAFILYKFGDFNGLYKRYGIGAPNLTDPESPDVWVFGSEEEILAEVREAEAANM